MGAVRRIRRGMRCERRVRALGASAVACGAAIALTHTGSAAACTLCQVMTGESLKAYIGPTIVLSAVPVAILGSIALWLWRAGRRTPAVLQSTAKPESPGVSAD